MLGYTQTERMCRVVSALGPDALLLRHMTAHESISGLFEYELDLLSESENLGFEQIVGKPLAVSVELANHTERWFHGIVARFSQGASEGRFAAYRALVVPRLWLLTRRTNCRIFQHESVPDIARKLFTELGLSDYKLELAGKYPQREYCVQYRETDFTFLSRLFEHEGIGYFFEHTEKAHTLVLFDSPGANSPCPEQPTAIYASASDEGGATGDVYQLACERELRPGAYALTDYNFAQPSLSLLTGTASAACVGSNPKLEVYDYPGSFLLPPEAEARVKCRMEAEECASVRVRGESRCAAFTPGYRFDLRGHFRSTANDTYLITSTEHRVSESAGETNGEPASYANTFECIPHAVPFRPAIATPAPRIHGVQTATVVGANGKEIDVDAHARVVVKFHWDRKDERNENSSCRVRVAQNWAGKGWGLIAHPRIGQEVVVEFLEGDPDRPLVTGRVYNGEQTPPYALPANATQTGLKSRSSPGGGGFNEMRFEDKAGSELIFIQAEKDRTTQTKNDDTQGVGHDRTRSVGNDETVSVVNNQKLDVGVDRTRSVGSNESVTIGSNRTKKVGADENVSIGANHNESVGASENLSVTADRTRKVGGNETITVAIARTHSVGVNEMINVGAAQEITVGAARVLTVGLAQTTSIGAIHSVTVGASQSIKVGSDQSTDVGGDDNTGVKGKQSVSVGSDRVLKAGGNYQVDAGKAVTIVAADQIVLKTGSASITLKKNGDISIDGKNISVNGSGNIVMKAKKVMQN